MVEIGQFIWIAFFAAVFLLLASKRGNWATILAFVGFAISGFAFALVSWGVLNYSVPVPAPFLFRNRDGEGAGMVQDLLSSLSNDAHDIDYY